jgi:diguanylate cyclase (GGDEF)-like protein
VIRQVRNCEQTLGHPAGDELLGLVAARLRQCVRDQDLIARLGGGEFAIIVANPTGGPALADAPSTRPIGFISAPY